MKTISISLVLISIISFICFAWAAEQHNAGKSDVSDILRFVESNKPDTTISAQERYRFEQLASRKYYVLILATLSMASLLIVLFLMRRSSPTAEDIVLVMGLNFVIFGTIISVLIIETTEQLSAITGILGAMGGYLFGSKGREELTRRIGLSKSGKDVSQA